MSSSRSKSLLSLIKKPFDSKRKEVWEGRWSYRNIFSEMYIRERYGDLVHFLPFVQMIIKLYDYIVKPDILILDSVRQSCFYTNLSKGKQTSSIRKECNAEFSEYKRLYKTDKRFVYIPIKAVFCEKIDSEDCHHHAMGAFFDVKNNSVAIFDSSFSGQTADEDAMEYIKSFFKRLFNKNISITYLPDSDEEFDLSLENFREVRCDVRYRDHRKTKYLLTSEGFCVVWALYFLEMRLKHPNKTSEYIYKKLYKALHPFGSGEIGLVCKVLYGYTQFIMDTVKGYDVIEDDNGARVVKKEPVKPLSVKKESVKPLSVKKEPVKPLPITKKMINTFGIVTAVLLAIYVKKMKDKYTN